MNPDKRFRYVEKNLNKSALIHLKQRNQPIEKDQELVMKSISSKAIFNPIRFSKGINSNSNSLKKLTTTLK